MKGFIQLFSGLLSFALAFYVDRVGVAVVLCFMAGYWLYNGIIWLFSSEE